MNPDPNRNETVLDKSWRYRKRPGPEPEQADKIKKRVVDWPELDREIALGLLDGDTMKIIAERLKCKTIHIRGIAQLIDWRPTWRKTSRVMLPQRKLTLSYETILRLYNEDKKTLDAIGQMAGGMTRERIRQILLMAGHDPVKSRAEKKIVGDKKKEAMRAERKKIVEANKTKRRQRTFEYYAPWRDLWAQGVSMDDMAEKLGKAEPSMNVTICRLRQKFGWFPKRRIY